MKHISIVFVIVILCLFFWKANIFIYFKYSEYIKNILYMYSYLQRQCQRASASANASVVYQVQDGWYDGLTFLFFF